MSVSRQAARGAGDRRSDGLDAHLAFTERYRGLVNEPDPEIRRSVIQDVGTPDGANDTRSSEAVGDGTLGARVTSAGDSFVALGRPSFRSNIAPSGHHGVVKVVREMVTILAEETAPLTLVSRALADRGPSSLTLSSS
jgi:hypothetical protein